VLVGTRDALGLVQWLRLFPSQGGLATRKWFASMEGRWWGWCTWMHWDMDYVAQRRKGAKIKSN
jgi:hypothetical protein